VHPRLHVPADLPGRDDLYGGAEDWLSRGNTTVVGPDGEIIAGPLVEEEGIVYAELDAHLARTARRHLDVAGHYGRPDVYRPDVFRPDVFRLDVDRRPKPWVCPTDPPPEHRP
jgi:nitrilase